MAKVIFIGFAIFRSYCYGLLSDKMIANSVIYAINESAYIILDGGKARVNEKHKTPGRIRWL
ncbi:MAG: hypothetical protein CVV11_18410 [Gammaproteobacteria bacterium HGW-Gammaproteobacteria-15]|nr:MAG: hypothetical protein CVV11_18410 [Gammaproteobacteria bacterium HGW-Gammaproteobacteria-15]